MAPNLGVAPRPVNSDAHFPHRLGQAGEHGPAHHAVADIELLDPLDGGHRTDVFLRMCAVGT